MIMAGVSGREQTTRHGPYLCLRGTYSTEKAGVPILHLWRRPSQKPEQTAIQFKEEEKKDEMEPMSSQFKKKKKRPYATGVCLAGTHNVRGRFDAFHGANGICDGMM